MSTPAIIKKLTKELDAGITTEVQVVYLLAGVRKLMERDEVEDQFPNLKFHCDWVLHPKLQGTGAKAILRKFDAAHPLLKGGVKLQKLPADLRGDIERISKMRSFQKELDRFLDEYGLPPLIKNGDDGWAHFLYLYAKVVEDIPLSFEGKTKKKKGGQGPPAGAPKHISQVTVHFQQAKETLKHPYGEEVLFAVTWVIQDKNGESGSIPVYNSFSLSSARGASAGER
jgi:hypothetical protein